MVDYFNFVNAKTQEQMQKPSKRKKVMDDTKMDQLAQVESQIAVFC